MTNTAPTQALPQRKLSIQMCALLLIFTADPRLMKSVEPFIDLKNEAYDWEQIRKIPMGSGHLAAVSLAFGIWTDRVLEDSNPFELALNMDRPLQRACLQALSLRWGLKA